MGRLQRKKPVTKKKKKKENGDHQTIAQTDSIPSQKTPISSVGAGDKKPITRTKPVPVKKSENYFQKGIQFLREVKAELKKVTWPSRKQTIGSTVVVITLVMIISLFLGLVDMGLSSIVRVILR